MVKACLTEGKTEGIKFRSKQSAIMAEQLNFTEKQANAILDMRLYKLIGLEIEALMKENAETNANIYKYEDILESKESMAAVIMQDLDDLKKEYGTKRKTVIENSEEAVYEEKKIEDMDLMFIMDRFGYCKTIDVATYERNKDAVHTEFKFIVKCRNTGRICLFTNKGQLHTIKVSDIPFGKFRDKGLPIDNISNYDSKNEDIITILSQSELNLYRLAFITKYGMCKLVSGGEFDVAKKTVASTKLGEDDEVVSVEVINEQLNIILQTKAGYFLRFDINEISELKKTAVGVRGMKLSADDYIENVYYREVGSDEPIEYKDKIIELNRIKINKRDAKGTKLKL
jgi:DNA gyrase subunit A